MKAPIDRWNEHGPFDIIGDIHGCFDELRALLEKLGYAVHDTPNGYLVIPPLDRKVIFLGDLVDRGPRIASVLRLVMAMVGMEKALCLPGNHDNKLLRKLKGSLVQMKHGLPETMEQLAEEPDEFRDEVREFLEGLPSHYILDEGRLIVAHAGLKESLHGVGSKAAMDYALFGEPTGKLDAYGLPERRNWAANYEGKPLIVYGHTPVLEAAWQNNTVDIDTGCVFGGKLTALRYPQMELVDVPALKKYSEPGRPLRTALSTV